MSSPELAFIRPSTTIVDMLEQRCTQDGDKVFARYLDSEGHEESRLTYQQLWQRSMAVAADLQGRTALFDRILLLYPPGLDFVVAFMGCLMARRIPVPVYPPTRNRNSERLHNVIQDCGASLVYSTTKALATFGKSSPGQDNAVATWFQGVAMATTDRLVAADAATFVPDRLRSGDVAFLQYTSGSTGSPKGVMVTHGNIMANEAMIHRSFKFHLSSVMVSWLPAYHDMGLIGGILQPLYCGGSLVLLAPATFLQKPLRWLQAVSTYGGTCTGAPNFGYDLCARKIKDEDLPSLNLASLEVAYCGAEPIRPQTIDAFCNRFASVGFKREMFFPCYGMAEATLLVSSGPAGVAPRLDTMLDAGDREMADKPFVGCGAMQEGAIVRVVNPATNLPVSEGQEGEICVAGPSIALGYWNRSRETLETFHGVVAGPTDDHALSFLRTGDLGFLKNGEIFVTGRIKDLIIMNGKNIYPQDVEQACEAARGIRPGCTAAFSLTEGNVEHIAIVAEIDRHVTKDAFAALVTSIIDSVNESQETPSSLIVLLEMGTLPKTSSGKIQRRATKQALLEGKLPMAHVWTKPGFIAPVTALAPQEAMTQQPSSPKPATMVVPQRPKMPLGHETKRVQMPAATTASAQPGASSPVSEWLAEWIEKNCNIARSALSPAIRLASLGLESVEMMEMVGHIEEKTGAKLEVGLIYQLQTFQDLINLVTEHDNRRGTMS